MFHAWLNTQVIMPPHVILVDASYFICYRYYAVRRWWGYARGEDSDMGPFSSERFTEKYRTTFRCKLSELPQRVGLGEADTAVIIAALDCPAEDVWRRKIWPEYKATRAPNADLARAFQITRDENLLQGANLRIGYPELEADDCIALAVKHILPNTANDIRVTIVSSDRDYLQLLGPRVRLVDLKGNVVTGSTQADGGSARDLFCKIVSGDKSDNIPAVAPRVGPKTAARLYADSAALENLFRRNPGAQANYKRNHSLIAFDALPPALVKGFYEKYASGIHAWPQPLRVA